MVKTLCFQCMGCGFNPWSGSQDLPCSLVQQKKKKFNLEKFSFSLNVPLYPILCNRGENRELNHWPCFLWGWQKGPCCRRTPCTVPPPHRRRGSQELESFKNRRQILKANFMETDVEHRICNKGDEHWPTSRCLAQRQARRLHLKTVSCLCPQKREDSASMWAAQGRPPLQLVNSVAPRASSLIIVGISTWQSGRPR